MFSFLFLWTFLDLAFTLLDDFTFQTLHDRLLPALGPQEINPLWLLLVMHKPPVPVLKQTPHQHPIIAFTHKTFIIILTLLLIT